MGRLLDETKGLLHHRDDLAWLVGRMIAAFASPSQQDDIRDALKDWMFPSLGALSDLLKVCKVEKEPRRLEEAEA
jgi:hypothetical protein